MNGDRRDTRTSDGSGASTAAPADTPDETASDVHPEESAARGRGGGQKGPDGPREATARAERTGGAESAEGAARDGADDRPERGEGPERAGSSEATVFTGVTQGAGASASARGPGVDAATVHVDRSALRVGPAAPSPPPRGHRPAAPRRAPTGPRPGPRSAPPSGPVPQRGTGPLPGTMIVDRYRLVAQVGEDRPAGAVLWKARDVTLDRDVAVTLLIGDWRADARASSTLARASRNAEFEHPHAARMLDVVRPGAARLPDGVLGAAVAEWTPGRDLTQLVRAGPLRPSAALRVIEQLADAVAAAHRSGLVLGMEHPQRVRVSTRASARLAFPLARGEAAASDDVQGLGALMYLLLTGRWPGTGPSADPRTPAGLTLALRKSSGGPVPARQVRPDMPVELAALVDRTLDGNGGIRTAAAVHRLIVGMREGLEESGVLLPVLEDGEAIEGEPGAVWHSGDEADEAPDPERRRKLRIGVTALVLATLTIVAYLTFQLVSLFGGGSSPPPLVIPTETPAPAAPPAAAPSGPPPPGTPAPAAGPVRLASVAVYAPSGDPDNPNRLSRAVDGNPSTTWSTSEYREQFPSLKPGVGVMTTFGAPSTVSSVDVRSPSRGTRIEVRTAPAADVPLSRTQLIGSGTVEGDELRIPVQAASPTSHLLIWITELGEKDDDRYVSQVAEVTVQPGA